MSSRAAYGKNAGWDGKGRGSGRDKTRHDGPLGGMPSRSCSVAFARAAVASWGRAVRMSEAERGRGRALSGLGSSGRVSGLGSLGFGGEEEDMVAGGRLFGGKRSKVAKGEARVK